MKIVLKATTGQSSGVMLVMNKGIRENGQPRLGKKLLVLADYKPIATTWHKAQILQQTGFMKSSGMHTKFYILNILIKLKYCNLTSE